jgi:hypothetical protein
MPANFVTYSSYSREQDMVSIPMDSNLYFEQSLQERRVLLNRIVMSYHSTAISSPAAHANRSLTHWYSWQNRRSRNAKYFS